MYTKPTFRLARPSDLSVIIDLLSDDILGQSRENAVTNDTSDYESAFHDINQDPNNGLIVAELDGTVVAVLQLTFIPNLTYKGSWRAQIEGVRVHKNARRSGIGRALIEHAIELAKEKGCGIVQLTTDKRRPEALKFYTDLGFQPTHEGMKIWL